MSGSVFQRKDTWYYRIPAKSTDGRYVTIWKGGFETRDEAERAKRRAEVARDERGQVAPSRITVAGYLDRWLRDREIDTALRTQQTNKALIQSYVVPVLGKLRLRELSRRHLIDLYVSLQRRGIHATAANVHHVLRNAFAYAVRLEYLDRNPTDGLPTPKVPPKTRAMPSQEKIEELLEAGGETRIGEIVRLVIWTGLRQGEVLKLRWRDVDLGRRIVHVREAKHNSVGAVALSHASVARLVKWRLKQREQAKALGPAWKDNDLVFPNVLGGPLAGNTLRADWGALRDRVGLKSLRFHDLRHLHASLLIEAGLHPRVIQSRMRHKDFATTMNVYGHLMDESAAMAPALDELDLRFKG